jgi:hypothetical protein
VAATHKRTLCAVKRIRNLKAVTNVLQRYARQFVVIGITASLYWSARLPEIPETEKSLLASRFAFTRAPLPEVPGPIQRSVRLVHPTLQRISAWISAVGAAVALNDLDGDGLPNDVCYVDTRTDQVIVAPVPGTPARYQPFALDPAPLPYNRATMAPMGCLPGDLNEDGRMDLLVYYWGRTPIAFLRRADSMGPAAYVAREIVPGSERWYTNAATLADLDGDGHIDLIIGNYFPDESRIIDANADPRARESMQHSMSRADNGGGPRFLLWKEAKSGAEPTVRFDESRGVLAEEIRHGWTLAIGGADLDGDLLPEIYLANDFGPDRLLHNRSRPGELRFVSLQGEKTLTTPNSKVLGRDSFKGMGVDFGDLNGDALLDIYVSNIAAEYALEESHFVWVSTGQLDRMSKGIAPYVDRSESLGLSRSGWGWEARLGDFDNDGVLEALQATGFIKGKVNRWPELHELALGNDELVSDPRSWHRFQPGDDLGGHGHNPFFVRAKDGRYYDIARELGLAVSQISRGIATADVDGDGRLDFAVANQWETSYFYRNTSPSPGAFLTLHLRLPTGSETVAKTIARGGHPAKNAQERSAIGAAATVYLPDGRRLVSQVDGGNGHSGKRSSDLHFGLGTLPKEARLRVDLRWRDAAGELREETMHLNPGWHTVLLASRQKAISR